ARYLQAFGLTRHLYLGGEFDWASITSGPRLVGDVTARGTTTTMGGSTGGFVAEGRMLIGMHATFGSITLAADVGPGLRIASYTTNELPDDLRPPAQAWVLIDGHVRANAWLTPHVTLGVQVGRDLLRGDNVDVGMTFGIHFVPFDGTL
ncbi:MAG: hypothetical protein JWO36_7336, partial [Myxococcales bacterium]|nr:hypothetical protein [Myxococcales bacterium]